MWSIEIVLYKYVMRVTVLTGMAASLVKSENSYTSVNILYDLLFIRRWPAAVYFTTECHHFIITTWHLQVIILSRLPVLIPLINIMLCLCHLYFVHLNINFYILHVAYDQV